ncbi:MAG: hypothetical protein LLP51_10300 [Halorhodospira halophila]|uniref:hypothetical protein n=1 Tax=Halorhodospira halophila TaxID=1053 RepID=UPI0026EB9C95|nr:hypothetical protein [Halorhodospira halophila]MCC3751772.1 hypothetical protein [Halorhodospira halophila]
MPRTPNPNYANPHWARAAENLGKIIAGPDARQQLEMESMAAQRAGQDLENRQLADALDADERMRFGMTYGGTPDGGTEAQSLGGGGLTDPESGAPTMFSGLAEADPAATGHEVDVPTSQDYGPRELMRDAVSSGRASEAPDLAQALGGINLAEGRSTPDQMRAYMAGAGQQPGADLALTTGRADQLRAEDRQHDLAEVFAEREADWTYSPEALVHEQLAEGNVDAAALMSEELGVRGPLSSDEQIARDHRRGDPEAAAALSAIRYGEGPQAPGDPSGLSPEQMMAAEERLFGLADRMLPENMSGMERAQAVRRASEILQQTGGEMAPTQALMHAVQAEAGGVEQAPDTSFWRPLTWGSGDSEFRGGIAEPGAPYEGPRPQRPQQPQVAGQPESRGRAGFASHQETAVAGNGGSADQVVMLGPDGEPITQAEIEETARGRDMSPEAVEAFLLKQGAQPRGQGAGGGRIQPGDMYGTGVVR